ncbi:melanoma-associated antigen 10-like [Myotis daubentonii]|uniref:melanoma-associated antigen 10-like n=1 Tax=Myotis daubentonii TaxID=98922 RepID=UPI0028734BCE|nr:melanoma-associated antigen 10-like [Myotis daubentonii]XP_059535888.1 melanoma-associated antigen 10-like [Myotis daubentonii]
MRTPDSTGRGRRLPEQMGATCEDEHTPFLPSASSPGLRDSGVQYREEDPISADGGPGTLELRPESVLLSETLGVPYREEDPISAVGSRTPSRQMVGQGPWKLDQSQSWLLSETLGVLYREQDPISADGGPGTCHSQGVIMPRVPKSQRSSLEIPVPVEEDSSSSSSTPVASSSSSSTSSSCYPLLSSNPSTSEDAAGAPSSPVSSPSAHASPTALAAAAPLSQSISEEGGGPSTSWALPGTESLPRCVINDKVADLVGFLLLKYRTKEQTTRAEMLSSIIREHQDHFAVIFREASECMQLVYGIDVKEVDPTSHTYVLVTNLGLSYDGMVSDEHSMPKTGLLILILSIIVLEDDCVPEERIWEALNAMGVHAGMEHSIYGEPRELLTRVWVQEQYLEYRQVPNSDPARYEFLWGPRAHAETTKLKVLEFLSQVSGGDPRSFTHFYQEALREEEQRAQARVRTTDDTTAMASASSSAMPSGFFCLD